MRKKRGYSGGPKISDNLYRKLLLVLFSIMLAAVLAILGMIGFRVLRPAKAPSIPEEFRNQIQAAVVTEEETWAITEAADFAQLASTGNEIVDAANRKAMMYDYDTAIAMIQSVDGYENEEIYASAIAAYEDLKGQCVQWTRYDQITHVFFHTLVVDEELAFASDDRDNYNQVMTTVDEFNQIIQSMYDRGYVLISLHKIAKMETQPDGTRQMVRQPIWLPKGKKPFVLSEDDVCYYEYMTGEGFATKLLIDENGKVVNEYINRDGSVSLGAYDVLPILEEFIEKHPDFSYQGSKGILAFTGYNGVLGYRTSDFFYRENCDYYIPTEKNDHQKNDLFTTPNYNIDQDKAAAAKVAQAIRDLGWEMASHSWGHHKMKTMSFEDFCWDTDIWEREVEPIIGPTDIILYPNGSDIGEWMMSEYGPQNPKFVKLKSVGFDYFCNVDSAQYWVQIGSDFFRQGRRNLDGQMIYKQILHPERMWVSDLFEAEEVFSPNRPLPVPGTQ